jgi:hypothetical protein
MLSDGGRWLATALAVCLEKKKRRWMKEWLKKEKRNEYTNENS